MQFLEAIGFRTDIAVAENILGIPADRDNLAITSDNLQSTGCFTQRTCCVAGLCSGHTAYLLCPKDKNPGELLRAERCTILLSYTISSCVVIRAIQSPDVWR